jgi:RNA polymerase sigma factor (sigma-70 family)
VDKSKTIEQNIQAAIDLVLKSFNLPPNVSRDDLSQDVWVKMLTLQRDGRFDPENARAFNYICAVARGEILDALKSAKAGDARTYRDSRALDNLSIPPDCDAVDADDEKSERMNRLAEVWGLLSAEEQEMLNLYYIQGLSLRDAARRVGYSHQTFSQKLAKLLKKVRTKLGVEGIVFR